MLKYFAVAVWLVASVAQAGNSTLGGSGGGTTTGTPSTCARFNGSGVLVSAGGDCTNGDSAGSTPAFNGLTSGTNGAAAMHVGTGASLDATGAGSIVATHAVDAGVLKLNGSGSAALAQINLTKDVGAPTSPVTMSGGVFGIDTTVRWPVPGLASDLDFSGIVMDDALNSHQSDFDTTACPANQWMTKVNQVFSNAPTCAQPAFTNISGLVPHSQLADNSTNGSCTNCNVSFDAKGFPSSIASGSNAGEANTCTDLGGGLALCTKVGVDLRFNTLSASDFVLGSNLYTLATNVVRSTRSISTSAPLQGGGDLSANRTISIQNDAVGPTQIDETVQYSFQNLAGDIKRNGTAVHVVSCTALQGHYWYDTTDSHFKFCDANSGTPIDFTNVASLGDVTDIGDCTGGNCFNGANGTTVKSNTDYVVQIDADANGSNSYRIKNGAGADVCTVDETGAATFAGPVVSATGVSGGMFCAGEPSGSGIDEVCFRQTNPMAGPVNCDFDATGKIPTSCLTTIGQTRTATSTITVMGQNAFVFKVPAGGVATAVSFSCASSGTITTAPTYTLQECATDGTSCASVHAAPVACGVAAGAPAVAPITTFSDTSWAAGAWIRVLAGTTGVIAGEVQISVDYTQ